MKGLIIRPKMVKRIRLGSLPVSTYIKENVSLLNEQNGNFFHYSKYKSLILTQPLLLTTTIKYTGPIIILPLFSFVTQM